VTGPETLTIALNLADQNLAERVIPTFVKPDS